MITKEDKFIQEGLNQIDEELKRDNAVKQQADEIAQRLIKNPKDTIFFNGKTFTLSLMHQKGKIILLFLSDSTMTRAKIVGRPPLPGRIVGEYNDEFSEHENLVAVVEAFLLNELGEIKVSSEDEGTVKVAREKDFRK